MLIRITLSLLLLGIPLGLKTISAEEIRLLLKSGGSVSGLEIKRNAQYHFIDLGFGVLRVPVAD